MNAQYPSPASPDAGAPQTLGDFRILDLIGRGGMGEVYRAERQGPGGQRERAAMKRILPRFQQDPTVRARFLAEARINARLEHSNIVRVLEFGEVPEPFLALEYVEGATVARALKLCAETRQRLPPAVAAFVIAEAATGLDFAHRRTDEAGQPLQIIHRDVSPQNILVSSEGAVKISDFGIARAADNQLRTAAGIAVGKLAYMAPEQVSGGSLDWRVDVFGLGVVLWETLLVRPLIPRNDQNAAVQLLLAGRFEPPSRVDPSLSPVLDKIVLDALTVDPNRRTASAGLLAQQLRAYLHQNHPGFDAAELVRRLAPLLPEVPWNAGLRTGAPQVGSTVEQSPAPSPSPAPGPASVPMAGPVHPRQPTMPPPTAGAAIGVSPLGGAPSGMGPIGLVPMGAAPPLALGGVADLPPPSALGSFAALPPPPRPDYALPPTPSVVRAPPAPVIEARPRDPKTTARMMTAVVVAVMLGLVVAAYAIITSGNRAPAPRRQGVVAVQAVPLPEIPPEAPPARPRPPDPPARVVDYTPRAMAAITSVEPRVTACLRRFRNVADAATATVAFDNANGAVTEHGVTYARDRGRSAPLTECLSPVLRAARFTPDTGATGFTRVQRTWPLGRLVPGGGGGGGGDPTFFGREVEGR